MALPPSKQKLRKRTFKDVKEDDEADTEVKHLLDEEIDAANKTVTDSNPPSPNSPDPKKGKNSFIQYI
jgi:hypothetical protein